MATWAVPCDDVAGRERAVSVISTGSHILLGLPAGESAVLTPQNLAILRAVLELAEDTYAVAHHRARPQ